MTNCFLHFVVVSHSQNPEVVGPGALWFSCVFLCFVLEPQSVSGCIEIRAQRVKHVQSIWPDQGASNAQSHNDCVQVRFREGDRGKEKGGRRARKKGKHILGAAPRNPRDDDYHMIYLSC